ncbi:50S ribosomal protein L35 [Patescibacteria group bacterium]|nr:50S ribosomal protein L35 [Patescibacteria group bacterium]
MKLKTNKAINKRIRTTKKKKMLIRTGGQDHFNAKESGNTRRNKRRDKNLSKANVKNIKRLLPYS